LDVEIAQAATPRAIGECAEFVVMVCGDVMTMPGLPKVLSACRMDTGDDGRITGLF
jgi:formyltetrahydrofolate synthetase